jgi:hypothetical protein
LFALKVPEGFTLDVIILMDGVKPIHWSTKLYLAHLFGIEWKDFERRHKQTTIYESLKWFIPETPVEKPVKKGGPKAFVASNPSYGPRQDFRVSVLIKKKNLKKHNSHQVGGTHPCAGTPGTPWYYPVCIAAARQGSRRSEVWWLC